MTQFFTKDISEAYDAKNSRLAPISDNLHFLVRLVLNGLPARARILCVGVGTGAEILSLAAAYPEWSFTGIDPSAQMLDVCRRRLTGVGVMDRCTLIEGYVQDAPDGENFDAALSILVAHFVPRQERASFYRHMLARLKTGGMLVSAEISADLQSPAFPAMLENWEAVQACMGATPQQLQSLAQTLRETLHVITPEETETLLRDSGIALPVRFFQSFMITGWHGRKTDAG